MLAPPKKYHLKHTKLSAKPTGGESNTGLGLSIVHKIVERMHGSTWLESEFGKGATFVLEFSRTKFKV